MAELSTLECRARLDCYLNLYGSDAKIKAYLGGGTDGDVWSTSRSTAVKVCKTLKSYGNERGSYERLAQVGITDRIDDFWVPQMQCFDDELMVIEMDLMQHPPYIIDFGKVKLDRSPDFSPETLRDFEEQGEFQFEHNWSAVKTLLAVLESFQIYYLDPKRGNITFVDMP